MPKTKPWYQSVTIWINLLLAAFAFFNEVAPIVGMSPSVVALVAAGANLILRLKTDSSILPAGITPADDVNS